MSSLAGRRIVVTRRSGQGASLVRLLEEKGATVIELPAIEIRPPADTEPLDRALHSLESYDWLVFTSANAVSAVLGRLTVLGLWPRLTARGPKLASVGAATTAALRSAFPADPIALEPQRDWSAAALAVAFGRERVEGAHVLLPASSRAREDLPRELRARGAQVEVVTAYETVEPPELRVRVSALLDAGFDLVAFASPSAVEAFAAAAEGRARGLAAAVIGPTTADAARAAGLAVRAVAAPSTTEGLVAAVEAALAAA